MSNSQQFSDASAIAIVGMSCRFPGAHSVAKFWSNLCEGIESIKHFSVNELENFGIDPELLRNNRYVRASGWLEDAALFDAGFFGYSPREAEIMDPQHRVFLTCAWEAFEDAGYGGSRDRDAHRIGVFAAAGTNSYLFRCILANPELARSVDPFQIFIGNDKDYLPTRISYKLDLTGPSVNVSAGCSSGLVTVHFACQSLLNFQCDLALAGAAGVQSPEAEGYLYQEDGITSPDGHCRTFDAKAQGAVRGNGVGVVLLKRLEDAVRDGDHIRAVIRAVAVNNDGSAKAGYTAPGVRGQQEVIAEALSIAGISADTISYVEAHGTATPVGDPIEFSALTKAFRAHTQARQFCALGSVKTNIGHLDTAAGIAGLIKTALALEHRRIPASLHFNNINPAIDLAGSPFYVNTSLTEWKSESAPRRAGVSSFGIGGTNAHAILEEPPQILPAPQSRAVHLITLSAKSVRTLVHQVQRLATHLESDPSLPLADVAYTCHVGRKEFPHRYSVVGQDLPEIIAALRSNLDLASGTTGRSMPSFVFSASAPPNLQELADRLSLQEPLFYAEIEHVKSFSQYRPDRHSFFAIQYALAKVLMRLGVQPKASIGKGTGNLVARCLAGDMRVQDVLGGDVSPRVPEPGKDSFQNPADLVLYFGAANPLTEFPELQSAAVEVLQVSQQSLLKCIGKLWCAGLPISWKAFHADEKRNRVPLPTYPFDYGRYYVEPRTAPTESTSFENWLYAPSWKQAPLVRSDPATQGPWLLFADESAITDKLRAHLKASRIVTVSRADRFHLDSQLHYTIDPENPDHYLRLLESLRAQGLSPARVVHLWNVTDSPAQETFRDLQINGYFSLLFLAQAIGKANIGSSLDVFVISNGLQEVIGDEQLHPGKASLLGPVRVIPREYPNVHCVSIDIALRDAQTDLWARLAAELMAAPAEAPVAYRGRYRWIQAPDTLHLPARAGSPGWKTNGVYWITGGFGGLGLETATHLAKAVQARLILTGRSLPPAGAPASFSPLEERQLAQWESQIVSDLAIPGVEAYPGLQEALHELCCSYILNYFKGQGVDVQPGTVHARKNLIRQLRVLPKFEKFAWFFCKCLGHDGYADINEDVIEFLPRAPRKPDVLREDLVRRFPGFEPAIALLEHCAERYAPALAGDIEAISVLYPEGGTGLMFEAGRKTVEHVNARVYRMLLKKLVATQLEGKRDTPLRILEVGGGNGVLTGELLAVLEGACVEYYFTDLGRSFIVNAQARAAERKIDFMKFSALDISRDPVAQGYTPASFDMVLGLDVVHATPHIAKTIENLNTLLKPGGLLCLLESFRTHRWSDMVFGLAEGWWCYEDASLRREDSPLLTPATWEAVFTQQGFIDVQVHPQDRNKRECVGSGLVLGRKPVTNSSRIEQIQAYGSEVLAARADVADEQQMRTVAQEAIKRFGRVDGIIHCAGVDDKRTIPLRTPSLDVKEFIPKIAGTLVLDALVDELKPELFILFSSVTAVTGGMGQVGYTAANVFLDNFAHSRASRPGTRTVSINWDRWEGVGLAVDYESWTRSTTGQGLPAGMTVEQGLSLLDRIVANDTPPQVIVSKTDLLHQLRRTARTETEPVVANPEGPAEQTIAEVWQEALGIPSIGRHDDFSELGGDSLIAIQVVARLRSRLAIELPVRALFESPTIAGIAERVANIRWASQPEDEVFASVELEEGVL